jgi:hypothetical protein
MTVYPFIGTHKKDGIVVRFNDTNTGTIVAGHRFGDRSTGTSGTFNEAEFTKIWQTPEGQTDYVRKN